MEAKSPTLWERLTTLEPALVRGVVVAVVYILGMVGLNLTDVGDQVVAAWTAVFAILPLVQAWWTRSAVTPNAAVVVTAAADGQLLAGPASIVSTGDLVYVARAEAHDPSKVDNSEPHPYEG